MWYNDGRQDGQMQRSGKREEEERMQHNVQRKVWFWRQLLQDLVRLQLEKLFGPVTS